MIKRVFSNGGSMIVATGALYIVAIVCVTYCVSQFTDPNTIEGTNVRFYAALLLALGVVIMAVLQFCLNMYIANPIASASAAILVVIVACLTGIVVRFLTNVSLLQ